MVIINGVIHPVSGSVIQDGFVAWEGSRITAVGEMSQLPQGGLGEVIDAKGGHVTPGYIDAHCHLGVFGDSLGFEGEDGNECTDPITPHLRALDALNPQDRCFAEARAAGVTTLVTGPGSANPIGGQMLCVKTDGAIADKMVVTEPVSMKMATGENPKTVYHERKESPTTRMTTAALIRSTLQKAKVYAAKRSNGKGDFDPKLEALLPVLGKELPVHIHAHRADDIATALRIAREFDLDCVIVHGTEGHLIAREIAAAGVPVITGPNLTDRSKPELRNATLSNPAILAAAGVRVAICTDHPVIPIQYLSLCAALAVRGGMSEEAALAAITKNPAEILGLSHRLGTLEPGKDADIVVTPESPFTSTRVPTAVILAGRRVV